RHLALRRAGDVRAHAKALRDPARRGRDGPRGREPPRPRRRRGGAHGGLLPRRRALDRVPGGVPPARVGERRGCGPRPLRALRPGHHARRAAGGRPRRRAVPRRARRPRGARRRPHPLCAWRRSRPRGPAVRRRDGSAGGRGRDARGGAARPRAPRPGDRRRRGGLLGPPERRRRRAQVVRSGASLHFPEGGRPRAGRRPRVRAVEHRPRERGQLRRRRLSARPRFRRERRRMSAKAIVGVLLLGIAAVAARAEEPSSSAPVARVGNVTPTQAQVGDLIKGPLTELRMREQTLRQQGLEELIAQTILTQEAAAKGTTVSALIKSEVEDKSAPSAADLKTFYEANKDRYKSVAEADALKQIEPGLRQQQQRTRQTAYLRELRQKYGVKVLVEPTRMAIDITGAPVRGNVNAPVTIVEFSDFQCPFCGRARPTVNKVRE